jgi:hypothetical protein
MLRFLTVCNCGLGFKAIFPLNLTPLQPPKNFKFHKFFSHIESNIVASSNTNQTQFLPLLNVFLMQIFGFLLMRLKGKGKNMNKIRCFKMFGMLNDFGLSLWWMNKGRCT